MTQEKHSNWFISIVVLEKLVDWDRVKCQKKKKKKKTKKKKKQKLKKKCIIKIVIIIFLSYFVEKMFFNFMFKHI